MENKIYNWDMMIDVIRYFESLRSDIGDYSLVVDGDSKKLILIKN